MHVPRITILILITFACKIASDENNPLDEPISSSDENAEGKPQSNEMPSGKRENLKNYQSLEAARAADKKDSKKDNSSKLPMNCIPNYEEFCKTKFPGFQFNDGCHNCKCTKLNKNFCEEGDCRYYVTSFDEAADYCPKIERENKLAFEKQMSERKSNKNKTKQKSADGLQAFPLNNANKPTRPRVEKQIVKLNSGKTNVQISKNDLETLMKPNDFKKGLKKTINNQVNTKVNAVPPLENDQETKVVNKEKIASKVGSVNTNEEKQDEKPNEKLDQEEVSKDNDRRTEKPQIKKQLNVIKFKKLGDINKPKKQILPTKIKVIANPIKKSLSKLSKQHIIKAMIYQLAWNELTIERVLKRLRKKHSNKKTKKLLWRLKKIRKQNASYKRKILQVVKKEMKRNKHSHSHSRINSKDMRFFKSTLKKLMKLNKYLKEIKEHGGKVHKRRRKRKHYGYNASANLTISLVLIYLSAVFVINMSSELRCF